MAPSKKVKGRKSLKGRKIGRSRLKMKDWLIKMLEERRTASLSWRDKERGIFDISWKHASGRTWVEESDTQIFKLYALHTGKHREGCKPDPKKWKANFRCALNSLSDVKIDDTQSNKKGENACKVYRFLKDCEVEIKKEKDSEEDLVTRDSSRDSNMDEDTQEASVAPVIKMEAPSPASDDMSQPASPEDDNEFDHSYSKNGGLANIPNLPSFKNSVCQSGGIVECRFTSAVIKPSERIDIHPLDINYKNNKSEDDLNSEGEDKPMSDEEIVQLVDGFRTDYKRRDSESSDASSSSSSSILNAFWNDPALISLSFRRGIEPVVVKDQPHISGNPDWSLTSLK